MQLKNERSRRGTSSKKFPSGPPLEKLLLCRRRGFAFSPPKGGISLVSDGRGPWRRGRGKCRKKLDSCVCRNDEEPKLCKYGVCFPVSPTGLEPSEIIRVFEEGFGEGLFAKSPSPALLPKALMPCFFLKRRILPAAWRKLSPDS